MEGSWEFAAILWPKCADTLDVEDAGYPRIWEQRCGTYCLSNGRSEAGGPLVAETTDSAGTPCRVAGGPCQRLSSREVTAYKWDTQILRGPINRAARICKVLIELLLCDFCGYSLSLRTFL
jgi:hypothetical protein